MRTLVLSDIHAGSPGSRIQDPETLAPLFAGSDRIIYNGDCAEYCWIDTNRSPDAWVEALTEIATRDGRQVVWIRGNHDLPLDGCDYLTEEGILITHGHGFSGWHLRRNGAEAVPIDVHFKRLNEIYERGLCRRRRFKRTWRVCNAIVRMVPAEWGGRVRLKLGLRRRIARFIELYTNGSIQAVVMGHNHCSEICTLPGGLRLYQTGAWYTNGRPSVLVVEGRSLGLHWVERAGSGYVLGAACGEP